MPKGTVKAKQFGMQDGGYNYQAMLVEALERIKELEAQVADLEAQLAG